MATSESFPIKTTNKNPISRVVLLLAGRCLSPQFLQSSPSLISSPPRQQATHLVSFLLVLSPRPRSKKKVPITIIGTMQVNCPSLEKRHSLKFGLTGRMYVVCYLCSLVKLIQDLWQIIDIKRSECN